MEIMGPSTWIILMIALQLTYFIFFSNSIFASSNNYLFI